MPLLSTSPKKPPLKPLDLKKTHPSSSKTPRAPSYVHIVKPGSPGYLRDITALAKQSRAVKRQASPIGKQYSEVDNERKIERSLTARPPPSRSEFEPAVKKRRVLIAADSSQR